VETTADDVERSKPAPDIFQAALVRLSPCHLNAYLP
jgi:beta-phosphoglucomutase-like phosphatase (HAD superfamily)